MVSKFPFTEDKKPISKDLDLGRTFNNIKGKLGSSYSTNLT